MLYTTLLAALIPAVSAHMSMWHPSMYGFGQSYDPVTPLANKGFNQWWFHGYASDTPSEVMTLNAGSSVTIEIACNKDYTSYGRSSSSDACPGDAGSFHAGGTTGSGSGWGGNSESNLAGCALAIAYKSTASQVQPEDFTVMSIQERCVRQRDTSFALPANLPACPEGGCTCAWFWQGKNSADEMYMIGFRCDVQGGVQTSSYPKPAPPRRHAVSGPTQPMYWANTPTNLDYTPEWSSKPSYNAAWGWQDGAQTSAFGAGGGGGAAPVPSNSTQPSSSATATASESRYNSAAASASATASDYDEDEDTTPTSSADGVPEPSWSAGPTSSYDDGTPSSSSSSSSSSRRRRPTHTRSNDEAQPTWYNHAAVPGSSEAEGESSTSSEAASSTLSEAASSSTSAAAAEVPSATPTPQVVTPPRCKAGKRRRRSRQPHAI